MLHEVTQNKIDTKLLTQHINFLNDNKNPKDSKGNEYTRLHYRIEEYDTLELFLDSLILNNTFRGEINLESNKFDDKLGNKIAQIISNNNITHITIGNRNKPFSDRISKLIGESLSKNTSLKSLSIFLQIEKLSNLQICEFLSNPNSQLESLNYLKLNKDLLKNLSKYLNKDSKLSKMGFYYEPLKFVDLLYSILYL
jgi:hypothetical protein